MPKTKRKVFSSKDYLSGDGFQTNFWGPLAWTFLHTISFNYPIHPTPKQKTEYMNYVLSLQHVLPCKYCRDNLAKNFKNMPLLPCHMKNRNTFSRYIYLLHEVVNKMLNKKSHMSYCDVRERYEHFRSRCTDDLKESKMVATAATATTEEKGCTEPLYGQKAKCVIKVVPQSSIISTFNVDKKCMKTRKVKR